MIIITGSSGGIGSYLLRDLNEYDSLIGIYNKNKPTIENNKLILEKINLIDLTKIKKFIKKYNKKLNNLALIHCAAYKEDQLAINTDLKNWNQTIDINLTGSFLITREILKLMIKNNYGRIIFFSSSGALQGARGTSSYTASKAGIIGLSKVISKEYAQFNVTSNVLNLGAFDTGLYKKLNQSLKKKILSTIPSKKLGRLNNISNSIKFLIESEFVNGAVIDVNGGA
jgi:3-oxoacyl-[acyl-carrier protein] reductase|tara:strand:+ start:1789 stop:2469 length:681 start_codon:yes stop_codon:yes gene_type:complete